jgi:arylsulfatase
VTKGWELYHVDEDFSQAHDLAAQYPDKLEELKQLFEIQAVQNNVYPENVNSTTFFIIDSKNRPNVNEGKTKFTYFVRTSHIQESVAPNFRNTSFSIEADVDFGQETPNGMIVTMGGQFGGFGFWIKDGIAKFGYQNPNPDKYYEVAAKEAMKPGKHKVKVIFDSEFAKTKKPGAGGTATIYVDGKKAAEGKIPETIPFRFSLSEYYDIACDYGTTISKEYKAPFMLNGKINRITVELLKDK